MRVSQVGTCILQHLDYTGYTPLLGDCERVFVLGAKLFGVLDFESHRRTIPCKSYWRPRRLLQLPESVFFENHFGDRATRLEFWCIMVTVISEGKEDETNG
jgi:hypothetical protein